MTKIPTKTSKMTKIPQKPLNNKKYPETLKLIENTQNLHTRTTIGNDKFGSKKVIQSLRIPNLS